MFKLVRDSELRINLFARQGTREMKFNQGWGGEGDPYRRVRIEISARNQAGFEKCNPTARL